MAITLSTEAMIGVIVGSVFGGILLLLLLGCVVYFACCRNRRKEKESRQPAPVIREHRNGHGNPLYAAHPIKSPDRRSVPSVMESLDTGKAVGYAYPIRGGRPVSYPHIVQSQGTSSNPSTNETRSSNTPQKRPLSQLPPNAFRLPGLADKSISMSDSNLSNIGTLNPAYDASDEPESIRPVYRAQSLMQMGRSTEQLAQYKLKTSSMETRTNSKVYHYDGSLGRVTTLDDKESSNGPKGRHSRHDEASNADSGSGYQIRMARELHPPQELDESQDPVYAVARRSNAPQRLPRVPLDAEPAKPPPVPPHDAAIEPASPHRRSLTSELSFRAKGHIVTAEAFNFLDAFADDPPKS